MSNISSSMTDVRFRYIYIIYIIKIRFCHHVSNNIILYSVWLYIIIIIKHAYTIYIFEIKK